MKDTLKGVLAFAVILVMLGAVLFGGFAGCGAYKSFHRNQRIKDAQNKVAVKHVLIRAAHQDADIARAQNGIVQARAHQRFLAAVGIREAQDEISKTLTPIYVQWEAIQAQMKLANSPTHTQVYIPTGDNGVPLVKTTP